MPLWTDIIDPATLTGYSRGYAGDYDDNTPTLARWLPNRLINDITARFIKGGTGLVDAAEYRAYDAEIAVGRRQTGQRVTIDLPAIGQTLPISEYEQLRTRGGAPDDATILTTIQASARAVVRAIADTIELQRGIVLATGRATINSNGYVADDDFGRPESMQLTATSLWTDPAVSRLDYLSQLADVYRNESGGQDPGAFVFSRKAMRAMARGTEFQTQLINGGARNATMDQVQSTVSSAGLADIYQYDRQVRVNGVLRRVLDENTILLLPAPVDPTDFESAPLGSTIWGRTLTSTEPGWGIEDAEQPGIVTGAYRNEEPPMISKVIGDAIGMPVLANANLSLAAKVL